MESGLLQAEMRESGLVEAEITGAGLVGDEIMESGLAETEITEAGLAWAKFDQVQVGLTVYENQMLLLTFLKTFGREEIEDSVSMCEEEGAECPGLQ